MRAVNHKPNKNTMLIYGELCCIKNSAHNNKEKKRLKKMHFRTNKCFIKSGKKKKKPICAKLGALSYSYIKPRSQKQL